MVNKIIFSTLAFWLSLLSLVSTAQTKSNKEMEITKIDTVVAIQKTDSIATVILKTYYENIMFMTGVPLALEHYDKTISLNSAQNHVFVTYNFNKIKFYGSTGAGIDVKGIDKYPYHFVVIYDPKTNSAFRMMPEG